MKSHEFELEDEDPLIRAFADYEWIVSFLGEADSQFEKNLIFTANCSRGVEVITLQLKAPKSFTGHISNFYIKQLLKQDVLFEFQESQSPSEAPQTIYDKALIKSWEADKNCGQALLNEIGLDGQPAGKLLLVHPGSGSAEKSWHIDNFCGIAKSLKSKKLEVLFLLGPHETEKYTPQTINKLKAIGPCVSGLSLSELLGLISCAGCFLGNDSGITHLAAASGVKTIAVFGPTDPAVYSPVGPDVTIFKSSDADFAKKPSAKLQQQICYVLLA
jgi:ADP-heptose:LPS heptosyltransferase